jgi:hypothetical protein
MSSAEPSCLELKDTDRATVCIAVSYLRICVQVIPNIGVDQKVFGSIRTASDDITQKLQTYISLHKFGL